MTKRQLRRMVRYETAFVATFGAALGIAFGLLFGWGVVQTLPPSLASALTIPIPAIATLILIAALAGVAAASLPARRMTKHTRRQFAIVPAGIGQKSGRNRTATQWCTEVRPSQRLT